ncbi:MAG TPA: hypothetical protein VLF94_07310 [Chlamydiales bacterium]|nr:hypothetical protein [Chlamydiales bacterium]
MTKIGKGDQPPHEPTIATYRQDLEKNASKFLNALDHYQVTKRDQERIHHKGVMDESLALMRASAEEINVDGIRKQELRLENTYKAYIDHETLDNLSALREDLSELRDNNRLP